MEVPVYWINKLKTQQLSNLIIDFDDKNNNTLDFV